MKHKYSILTVLIFLLAINATAQNNNTAPQLLTPKQMQEDVNFYYDKLRETHPNPYQVLTPEKLDAKIQALIKSLDKPLDNMGFWFEIAKLNCYFDGHTGLSFPPEVEQFVIETLNEGQGLVKVNGDRLFFNEKYTAINSLLKGREIVSINHIPSGKLIEKVKKYISYEPIYQELFMPILIIPLAVNDFKKDISLHIEYKDVSGVKMSIDLKDDKLSASTFVGNNDSENKRKEICNYRYFSSESIAIIELNSFKFGDATIPFTEYCAKIKQYMDSAIHSNVQHLFVDITANGGGNSIGGYELLNYIQTDTISYKLERTDLKISPLYIEERILERKMKNREEGDSIVKILFPNENLQFGDIRSGNSYWTKEPVPEIYKNKFYLLQSRNTYSAAIDLAVLVAYYKWGKIIGEETGGLTSCYIDIVNMDLPNSKINAYFSIKWVQSVSNRKAVGGVLPDIEYKIEDPSKSFTLEELKEMLELAKAYKNEK